MKTILDTKLCKIIEKDDRLIVYVVMSEGGAVQLNPFDNDLRGLVAALTIATEVCAGKFWPAKVVVDSPKNQIDNTVKMFPTK